MYRDRGPYEARILLVGSWPLSLVEDRVVEVVVEDEVGGGEGGTVRESGSLVARRTAGRRGRSRLDLAALASSPGLGERLRGPYSHDRLAGRPGASTSPSGRQARAQGHFLACVTWVPGPESGREDQRLDRGLGPGIRRLTRNWRSTTESRESRGRAAAASGSARTSRLIASVSSRTPLEPFAWLLRGGHQFKGARIRLFNINRPDASL
jgi:hypothetical protein